jgi:twitching motility protein PilT
VTVSKEDNLFGRLALHYKLLTRDQLADALQQQAREGYRRKIGEILIERGLLTPQRFQQLLQAQREYEDRLQAAGPAAPAPPTRDAEPPPGAAAGGPPPAAVAAPAASPAAEALAALAEGPPPSASLLGMVDEAGPILGEPASLDATIPVRILSSPAAAAQHSTAAAAPAVPVAAPAPRVDGNGDGTAEAEGPHPAARAAGPTPPAAAAEVVPPPRPVPSHAVGAGQTAAGGEIAKLLALAVERKASDLHLHAGLPARLRIDGDFLPIDDHALSPADTRRLIEQILTPDQLQAVVDRGQVDFAYTLEGVGRFRANTYRQQRGWDGVFRVIPPDPPSLSDLGLPLDLARFANWHQGLVLITGPTGSGKSSTLAALIRIVNEERRDHIITVEDPVEFVHKPQRCVINQRQVGDHTRSFSRALRAALREDPDVIVVGELRDLETISLALTAAETGHLVLATLHTQNAINTINRLIGVFPAEQQSQIRTMVSESLRAITSQRLAMRADGKGRVPALEVMVANKAVANLIRENKTFQLRSVIQTGAAQGMRSLDGALEDLVKTGTITRAEAARNAEDPKRFAAAKPAPAPAPAGAATPRPAGG